ncbi:DUF5667 domain-containing protein [Frankia sp. CiP3]|uniref:DUF5667 domain-containing protein n=1 Tax=Frankia sp. CiP3 TaxID=2880971 RepID=UPI001EF53B03|nr:DUF5667 domain-containing protein [Frankia sp. CiP3]
MDVVTALRAVEQVSPREEFRASLRALLCAETPDIALLSGELPAGALQATDLPATELPATELLTSDGRTPARGSRARVCVRPALIGALATSVVVTGIAVNTHRALPGEPFYGLKLRVEQIQLDLTNSRVEKAKVHLDIARTRLGEIRTIMDDGLLPRRTTEVRALLTAWRNEASAGGEVLVAEARNGSDDALRTVRDFTADQSRDLRALLDGLPGGQLRTMTSAALDYVHGVNDTVTAAIAAPSRGSASEATPTQTDGSRTRQPARQDTDGTPPVSPSPAPVLGAGVPTTPSAPSTATTDVPAVSPTSPASTGQPANTSTATATTTPATGASRTPSASPTESDPAVDPEGIVAGLLGSAGPG